jgi:hypothetical protein
MDHNAEKKWMKIAEYVANSQVSDHYCDINACRDKWGSLYGDWKKIRDHNKRTGVSQY